MTTLRLLSSIVAAYSVLALVLVIVFTLMKYFVGLEGVSRQVNRLAGSRFVLGIEALSWFACIAWIVLVLPWLDLFTVQYHSKFTDDGWVITYFGRMTMVEANNYFILTFLCILGAKASITMAEMARLVRGGRVKVTAKGPFISWVRE